MFDLKCKRESCSYNQNCNCTAKNIDVSKNTECNTYNPTKGNKKEQDKIPQTAMRNETNVKCHAECLFNCEENCIANGITVKSSDACPCCCTFMPK